MTSAPTSETNDDATAAADEAQWSGGTVAPNRPERPAQTTKSAPAQDADPATEDVGEYTIIVATRGNGGDTQFLMVHNPERGWELPGGKFEGMEGPVHCALREFREETGHLLSEPQFVTKIQKPNGTAFVFKGHLGAKVREIEDRVIDRYQWFDRLPEEELGFPDDPYDEMGQAIGIRFR